MQQYYQMPVYKNDQLRQWMNIQCPPTRRKYNCCASGAMWRIFEYRMPVQSADRDMPQLPGFSSLINIPIMR